MKAAACHLETEAPYSTQVPRVDAENEWDGCCQSSIKCIAHCTPCIIQGIGWQHNTQSARKSPGLVLLVETLQ